MRLLLAYLCLACALPIAAAGSRERLLQSANPTPTTNVICTWSWLMMVDTEANRLIGEYNKALADYKRSIDRGSASLDGVHRSMEKSSRALDRAIPNALDPRVSNQQVFAEQRAVQATRDEVEAKERVVATRQMAMAKERSALMDWKTKLRAFKAGDLARVHGCLSRTKGPDHQEAVVLTTDAESLIDQMIAQQLPEIHEYRPSH